LSDEANSIDPNFLKNSGNLQELTELNNRLKSLTDKPSGYNYTPSEKKQIKDLGTKIRTLNLKRSNTSQISPQLKKIYDEMVLNLKEWKEFKRGYDDCINAYVKDGSASLWQRLDIDAIPQDTPYNRGRYYAAITLRAGWAYTDYSKSKWEQAFDVAKDSLSFGITIASHLV